MRTAALLPAAGSGERLGLGPKALVSLGESTLVEAAAGCLLPFVDELVIAAPAGLEGSIRRLVPSATVITGGPSRKATVHRLLESTSAGIVVIHDAARPFLPATVLRNVIAAAAQSGAASASVPLADTIIRKDSAPAPAREDLLAVQTPQAFSRSLLLKAHELAGDATDDAGLVARTGHSVSYVSGSPWLMKVTTAEDLAMARALAARWKDSRQ